MTGIDKLAEQLQKTITEKDKNKIEGYDTQATVVRVSDDLIWVKIPGGLDETPVGRTVACKEGDTVQVRVSNHRAWITGNYTAPATDDTRAIIADSRARAAEAQANSAIQDAIIAHAAADIAAIAADEAMTSAGSAIASAMDAKTAADEAKEDASRADASATNAMTSASNAMASATSAMASASNALDQLAVIENVVGVLDLLSKHGTYELTQDTQAQAGKWYFTRSGAGTTADPYVYSVADISVGTDPTGYYELTDIDQSVTNYVSSHLALTNDGLSLQQDGSDYRLVISTGGLKIMGANGSTVAEYGMDTTIGDINGFHVKIDGTELAFYQADRKVAYISNNQLYVTQSVVLQQMDLGVPVFSGGLGQWSWKVHPNGETPSRNNLNLKWIG